MHDAWKSVVASLTLLSLVAIVGCSRGGSDADASATASVSGPGSEKGPATLSGPSSGRWGRENPVFRYMFCIFPNHPCRGQSYGS
jgi:hypothetical protein